MAGKKKLGKGLDAIFGDNIDTFLNEIENNAARSSTGRDEIKISEIRPNPYQPRKDFDEEGLKELADSIKENGVFQPILVRKSSVGYELVAGERRLRASKMAGKQTIPVLIVEFDDRQMMEISLLENIQRKDLTPIEEASAYAQLIRKLNYTQEELARRIGKSRANVANMLRLLNLPDEIKKLVNEGKLSYGHARALLAIDDEEKMIETARKAVREQLSVRQLEELGSRNAGRTKKPADKKKKDPFTEDVKDRLQRKFGTKVDIQNRKLTIYYNDTKDLNRILEIMDVIED